MLTTQQQFVLILLLVAMGTEASAQNRSHRRRGIILGGLAGAALGVAIGDKGNNETAGALIGATAGAIAGGAIGHQKDQRIEQEIRFRSDMRGRHGPAYRPEYPMQFRSYPPESTGFRNTPAEYQKNIQMRYPARRVHAYPIYSQPYNNPHPRSYLANPHIAPNAKISNDTREAPPQRVPETRRRIDSLNCDDIMRMMRSGVSQALILRQVEMHGVQGQLSIAEIITLHEIGASSELIEAIQINATRDQDEPAETP